MTAGTSPLTRTVLEERARHPFDFTATVRSHGWASLAPFAWDPKQECLSRTMELATGRVVHVTMTTHGGLETASVRAEVLSAGALLAPETAEVRRAVRRMLQLEADLTGLFQLASQLGSRPAGLKPGSGRILRCPTMFEDLVCVICTTNIAWSGTKRMVARLVAHLGTPMPAGEARRAFPGPAIIAAAGPEVLRDEVRLGYRSDFVWALAQDVASGAIDLAPLADSRRATTEVREDLLAIRGVGPYAAATMLTLLGRYEDLAIDSAMRAFVSEKYFQGQPPTDDQIWDIYDRWGEWRSLAYWFDE